MRRRDLLAGLMAAGVGAGIPGSSRVRAPIRRVANQESAVQVKPVEELVTPETEAAIQRGLRYLSDRQVMSGKFRGAFGTSGYQCGVAVTSLAGLAFMCSGSSPLGGKYEAQIRRCTDYVLRHTRDTGYIAADGNHASNMYGHGYGMLYLSQVYGMSGSEQVGQKLRLAVDMTCNVQNDKGGWRYQPQKQPGDLSITICQIMALRAAHDAGIHVSEEVRNKTLDFVYKCQKSDGSFQYMLRGGRISLALTAAGVVSLYSAGIYEGDKVENALKWLIDRKPDGSHREVSPMNYYYAHYYAVQAMWHAQMKHPDYWNAWYPAIRDELLGKCNEGKWHDDRVGPEFATAMCCIILQIPYNYVPVFAP